VGRDLTLYWFPGGAAYWVWTRLPDELVHFSLESKPSQDCSEKWSSTRWRRTWNTIRCHATSFSPRSHPTLM
jgi:hypothetical protein